MSPEISRGNPNIVRSHFGVRREMLTDAVWQAIVAIYLEVAFNQPIDELDKIRISARSIHELPDRPSSEFRWGSTLNDQSKLFVVRERDDVINFKFFANFQYESDLDPSSPVYQEAARIRETFRDRVDELLWALGIAEMSQTEIVE